MSRILTIADIHINDYSNRNPDNRFRLYQGSRTVANNIIKVGKQTGCDIIVFAGDIVEKYLVRPYIQAEIKYFLDTIMSNFNYGFIIWGNHDLDNRSIDQDISDTILGVMLPSNLYYAHKKIVELDGCTLGFCNWMPEFDLSWIPNKVDVLFTHARICYGEQGGLFESQKLDESKFDLAICGDIHRAAQFGKYVSIGVPQKCKMGDSDDATGVVLDTSTKGWTWVNLNPDDNLMKFDYTTSLEFEGWHEENHTWYVYKQENATVNSDGTIRLDALNEINKMIEDAIIQSNLQGVHTEVLKHIDNIESGEVDFNFTLLRLRAENWRSIESMDLSFSPGDRILIQGENGSGKSSLLSALKYAFIDVSDTTGLSSLKPFIQFGKKDCFTEVTFLYQGNECRLLRGTKTYEHSINGELQKYNDKRSFEKDVRQRYPFIEYLDAFFFDANNQFLASLSPERETEITSKFLKLDRIETYNKTAQFLAESYKKEQAEKITAKKEIEKLLSYIDDKLRSITVPSISRAELESRKQEGLEIQRKNALWNQYQTRTLSYQAQLQSATDRLNSLLSMSFRSPEIIDAEVNDLQQQISQLQARQVELGNLRTTLNFKISEYNKLRDEGNNKWKEAQSIGVGHVCSKCGQVIKTTEAMENHKNELLQEVEKLRPLIMNLGTEIESLRQEIENGSNEFATITNQISGLNAQISRALSEKSERERTNQEIQKLQQNISKLQTDLNSLGVVDRVDLPEGFVQIMADIESGITSWNIYETHSADKLKKEQELAIIESELLSFSNGLGELESYIKLTGSTGKVFEAVMGKLAMEFSNNTITYSVLHKGKGNREHLSLVPSFNNNGNLVAFPFCSSGQQCICNLDFLTHLITILGVMSFDEFLKNLDAERSEIAIELIKNLPVGCIFLTSHLESMGAMFHNKICKMELDNQGLTHITLS